MSAGRVLITGGAGNLGKYVIEELKKEYEIKILDLKKSRDSQHPFVQVDIANFKEVEEALKDIEAIVHLAAIPYDTGEAQKIWKTNVTGTFNILEAAVKNNVKKIVFTSSIDAYGFEFWSKPFTPEYFPLDEKHPCKPDDTYGMSKTIGEKLCYGYTRRYGISIICLRLATVLYPGSEDVKCWVTNIENPEFYLMPDRVQIKDSIWAYVDARDAAQAFRLSLEKLDKQDLRYEIHNIGAEDVFSQADSLDLIRRYYPDVKMILNKEDFLTEKKKALFDITKAQKELGYRPKFTWQDHLSG
jgi:nucleoside-diphosphate-sugar epimerase